MGHNTIKLNTDIKSLPNFSRMDSVDGTIYGSHNKVESVNPFKCRFVAEYIDGSTLYGMDLFKTGWDYIPNGITKLSFELSTGHIIRIPRYIAYKHMVEVSLGMDGSRIFHFINVNCLSDKDVIIYKIVLRQDKITPYKIGDIIMSKTNRPEILDNSWKFSL